MEFKRSASPTKSKLQTDDNLQLEQLQSHWKIAKPRRKSSSPSSSRSPTPPKKMVDFVSHWKIPKSSSRPSSPPSIDEDVTHQINDSSSKQQDVPLGTSHRNNLLASPDSDGSVISGLLALSATPSYSTYFFPNHTINAAPVDRVVSCSDNNQRKRPIANPSEDAQEPAWKKSCHRPSNTSKD